MIIGFMIGFLVGSTLTAFIVSIAIFTHLNKIGCDLEPFYAKGSDNLRMKVGMKEKKGKKK